MQVSTVEKKNARSGYRSGKIKEKKGKKEVAESRSRLEPKRERNREKKERTTSGECRGDGRPERTAGEVIRSEICALRSFKRQAVLCRLFRRLG